MSVGSGKWTKIEIAQQQQWKTMALTELYFGSHLLLQIKTELYFKDRQTAEEGPRSRTHHHKYVFHFREDPYIHLITTGKVIEPNLC